MHELSIAMSLVEMAAETAARQGGARVLALHLKLGRLSGVAREALLFSWEVVCEGTALSGAQLEIEEAPVTIYCPVCGAERVIASIQRILCPVCETGTIEIVSGRELELVAMEMEQ
ncbi:MAG: hydrogenase maturation nickel metallochaperone HypA [Blastocatellia bacterium]|nr:hydrogenase maturation nickel metallochaperone HypA [Blastocatellia bacterium]